MSALTTAGALDVLTIGLGPEMSLSQTCESGAMSTGLMMENAVNADQSMDQVVQAAMVIALAMMLKAAAS